MYFAKCSFIFEKQIGYLHILRKKYHLESCALVVENNMLQGRKIMLQTDFHSV